MHVDDLRFDLQCHTRYSDGRTTIEQNVRMAEAGGLEALAITDHYFGPQDAAWLDAYLEEIQSVRATTRVRVLAGIEATFLDLNGTLSIDPVTAGRLDLVLVDLSNHTQGFQAFSGSRQERTARVIACLESACRSGIIHILAHPFNLGRIDSPMSLADFSDQQLIRLAKTCHECGVAFEVMNEMAYWFPSLDIPTITREYSRIVRIMAEHDVRLSVGSDAHASGSIGNLRWVGRVLTEAGIDRSQLVDPGRIGNHAQVKARSTV